MGVLSSLLLAAVALLGGPTATGPSIPAILAEFDRLCGRPLWPGFEPCRTPLVIFDGARTWFVRHPSPPADFAVVSERPDTRLFEGRHPSVRANTSVEVAGTAAASAILEGRSGDPVRLAALLIHETFHVFQGRKHPGWSPNEGDLFLYPADDTAALALRRLESAALRRGVEAGDRAGAAAWAARALEFRRERFALLPSFASGYERAAEMKEGLARYVQKLSDPAAPLFPEDEFPAAAVRDRAYASGAALALLLDRTDPGWKERVEEKDSVTLEDLLARAIAGQAPEAFASTEIESERRRAAADAAAGAAKRAGLRRDFLGGKRWKLVIETEEPLQALNFDPLNVERLSAGEVLHTRFVKLGNSSGTVEVLGRRCLTESAGKHPLFEGVRRATIALSAEPPVEETPEVVRVSSDGISLEFRGARVSRSGRVLRLTTGSR